MKIILSPAKKMSLKEPVTSMECVRRGLKDQRVYAKSLSDGKAASVPVFLDDAGIIMAYMKNLSYDEAKALWRCNDQIAELNYERFASMALEKSVTPAVLAYEGIAYKYMAPMVFSSDAFTYVQEHLRILSGFYGVLKPLDGVVPYRLEMGAKAKVAGTRDLYDFWGDRLYREVTDDSRLIINLASKEYSRCVERYLQLEDRYITCIFGELSGEKVVTKGTYAKMARGEMVLFMAEHQIEEPEALKDFDRLGYHFDKSRSTASDYVFIKG